MFLISNILLISTNFDYYLRHIPIILIFLLAKFILPSSKKKFFKFQSILLLDYKKVAGNNSSLGKK